MGELHKLQQFFHNAPDGYPPGTSAAGDTSRQVSPTRIFNDAANAKRIESIKQTLCPSGGEKAMDYEAYLSQAVQGKNSGVGATGVMARVEKEVKRQQTAAEARAIDDAIKQKAGFLRAKLDLLDSEEAQRRLHTVLRQDCERRLQEIAQQQRKSYQNLIAFDKGAKGDCLPDYSIDEMISDCSLTMTQRELKAVLSEQAPDPSSAVQILDVLLVNKPTDTNLSDLRAELAGCGLSEPLTAAIFDMHAALNSELLDPETTVKSLSATEHEIPAMLERVRHAELAIEKAKDVDDTSSVDALQSQCIAGMEQLLSMVKARLGLLVGVGSGDDQLLPGLRETKEASEDAIQKVRSRCDTLDQSVERDAQLLIESHDKLKHARRSEREKVQESVEACDASLADNERQQKELAEQLLEMHQRYRRLSDERWTLVNRRVDALEDDEAKQKLFEAQCKVQQEHLQTMQEVKDHLTVVDQLHKIIERWVTTAVGGIKKKMSSIDSELHELRLDEQKRHHEFFRRYYLYTGELIFKKYDRMRECSRLVRHHESSAQHAREVGDGQLNMHLQYAKELGQVRDACLSRIAELQKKSEAACADFDKTYMALRISTPGAVHPREEMQQQAAQLHKLSLSHRKRLFEADVKESEEEHHELQCLLHLA